MHHVAAKFGVHTDVKRTNVSTVVRAQSALEKEGWAHALAWEVIATAVREEIEIAFHSLARHGACRPVQV